MEEFTDQVILENISLLAPPRRFYTGAMLETKDLERCCPLDNGRHEGQEPSATLGQLDTLPLELLQPILLDVDLKSLTVFRSVNRTFRKTIDSIKEYDDIITHAPTSLRAALSINLGSWISCRQLYNTLCSEECAGCRRFGPFLYLLSCSRVCYVCLHEDRRFLPMVPKYAKTAFKLSSQNLADLPTALSIPGRYAHSTFPQAVAGEPNGSQITDRIELVDRSAAYKAVYMEYPSLEQLKEYIKQEAENISAYEASVPGNQPRRRPTSRSFPQFQNGQQRDSRRTEPFRFMCVVRIPWFDKSKHMVEWGLQCQGCKGKITRIDGKLDWNWLYTEKGYLEHVRQCPKSLETLRVCKCKMLSC